MKSMVGGTTPTSRSHAHLAAMMLCVQEHLEHRLAHRVHTGGLLGLLLENAAHGMRIS